MKNYVIIGVVVIIVIVGVISTVKHFRGQGGCCGGGSSYKVKKKRLSGVRYKKVFLIDGMHCNHCKNRVEETVNDVPGISGKVNLKQGELVVSYSEDIEDAIIKARIERAGYTVTEIKHS